MVKLGSKGIKPEIQCGNWRVVASLGSGYCASGPV
jgi:hypothetical protein